LKHERATEEIRELAALYALGSLTQHEARSFEIHRREGCSVCEAEIRKFEHAAAGIGFAAAEIAPPDYIRDLLSARIEREPQTASPKAGQGPAAGEKTESPHPVPAAFSLSSESRDKRPSMFPWVLVVVLAALGFFAAYSWRTAQETSLQLQAKTSATESDLGTLKSALEVSKEEAGNLGKILAAVGKPGVRIAHLIVQSATAANAAAVIWDTGQNQCFVLGNFPAAPEGKRYQLWFFLPPSRVSAGPFKINSNGPTFVTVSVPREAAGASAAVVTLEPDNGSRIPTSPYYAAGRIE
jgi:anti-sigma-K factor RskA